MRIALNTVRLGVVCKNFTCVETRRPSGDARSDAGVPEDRNAYATATLTPVAYGGKHSCRRTLTHQSPTAGNTRVGAYAQISRFYKGYRLYKYLIRTVLESLS